MILPVINNTHEYKGATVPVDPATHPSDVIAWGLKRFEGWTIAATTGFGMEGCMLLDILARQGKRTRVIYIDTHFMFDETLRLRDRLIKRYPELTFVNAGTMISPERQESEHGPELWKTDPDRCCTIRKTEPMHRALRGVDVWISGIRRGQSPARASIEHVQWDWLYQLVKINPLAYWSRERVWQYVREHKVPYNPLHDEGYPSIGCTHCTTKVPGLSAGNYSRDGRWPGFSKTECGIHFETRTEKDT